jgi:RNA polymerase sigma factor (sigma-70 family)
MAATDPDVELVRLAQANDARAFEALVVKYQRRIARHVARYLKSAADVPEERVDAFEPGVSDSQQPERTLIAAQIADTVQRALAKLQPDLAEALLLYEVESKPYAEIATMLGIPLGTVRSRIFRARDFIARRLEPVLGPQRNRRW